MTKKLTAVLIVLFLFGGSALLMAQTDTATHDIDVTIAAVALIGLDDATTISLTTVAPALAGDAVTGSSDSTKRLFYTSLNLAATTRTIDVQISSGSMPAGTKLTLDAVAEAGAGTGTDGTPIDVAEASDTTLVSAIPSVATGRTGTDGASLTYALVVTDPASLVVSGTPTTVTVQFTLTDDV